MNTQVPAGLAEREFSLIQEITRRPDSTQRELSQSVGCSLGMTNMLIKRLVRKGYIKATQLDWNKTRYLLTYKGAAEKARKSYAYALHSWQQARKITRAIQDTVIAEYRAGARRAVIVAWPETAALIRAALAEKDLGGLDVAYAESFKQVGPADSLVFSATVEPLPADVPGRRVVPLLGTVDLEFKFS